MSRKRREQKELALAWTKCPICLDPRRFVCKDCGRPVRDDQHHQYCPYCKTRIQFICTMCKTPRERLNTLAIEKDAAKRAVQPRVYGQRPPSRSFSWKGTPRAKFIH